MFPQDVVCQILLKLVDVSRSSSENKRGTFETQCIFNVYGVFAALLELNRLKLFLVLNKILHFQALTWSISNPKLHGLHNMCSNS